jgi:hypothetical protein
MDIKGNQPNYNFCTSTKETLVASEGNMFIEKRKK